MMKSTMENNNINLMGFIWSKMLNLSLVLKTSVVIAIFFYLLNLIAFDDVESIIIFDIFVIFFVCFYFLKKLILKQVYYSRNSNLSNFLINFFLRKRILLNLYIIVFRQLYTNLLISELLSMLDDLIIEEFELTRLNHLVFLREYNQFLLQNLVTESLLKYNGKIDFIIKDSYLVNLSNSIKNLPV